MCKNNLLIWVLGLALTVNGTICGAMTWNVKTDFGAAGDGVTDDTTAIQNAINAARVQVSGGEVLIPTGKYRVTQTLVISQAAGFIIRGEGCTPCEPNISKDSSSTIFWDGAAGGAVFKLDGILGSTVFRDMTISGKNLQRSNSQAGILIWVKAMTGFGSMYGAFQNLNLNKADVGVQMGENETDGCCADYLFENITFISLGSGFKVCNNQGVHYAFVETVAISCNIVFNFVRGGAFYATATDAINCGLVLNIAGGGSCVGPYMMDSIRVEEVSSGGYSTRCKLLVARPTLQMALVHIVGFEDAQWHWSPGCPAGDAPLCEVGPYVQVVIESSVFESKVALLDGDPAHSYGQALFTTKNCHWKNINPKSSVGLVSGAVNAYYRLIDSSANGYGLVKDVSNWPVNSTLPDPT
jgi:hypothetical protein